MKLSEDALLSRIESNMQRESVASQKEIDKLPRPGEILELAVGPAPLQPHHDVPSAPQGAKLLVVSRANTGYPVLGQFLADFFLHGDVSWQLESAAEVVTNLLNCVLVSDMVTNFTHHVKHTTFGVGSYFRSCLLEAGAVCSDPMSYEKSCGRKRHQLVKTRNMTLKTVGNILAANQDVKVVFLVRDPRAILSSKKWNLKAANVCARLSNDLDQALTLIDNFPRQFAFVKYEQLARSPREEVGKLLENLDIDINLAPSQDYSEEVWNKDSNSVEQINSWKDRLTMSELNHIENKCSLALSKLEYQMLATV